MSKKYFIISDVHNHYYEMMIALDYSGFNLKNDDDILISCGDLFDRGKHPELVLDFIMNKVPKNRRILIEGNHESRLKEIVFGKETFLTDVDYYNGVDKTIKNLSNESDMSIALKSTRNNKLLKSYLSECVDFYEFPKYLFVHGWFPTIERNGYYEYYDDWKNGDWDSARWADGIDAWLSGAKFPNKTVVCGHIGSMYGNKYIYKRKNDYSPFIADGIIDLDSTVVLSGKINVIKLDEWEM